MFVPVRIDPVRTGQRPHLASEVAAAVGGTKALADDAAVQDAGNLELAEPEAAERRLRRTLHARGHLCSLFVVMLADLALHAKSTLPSHLLEIEQVSSRLVGQLLENFGIGPMIHLGHIR